MPKINTIYHNGLKITLIALCISFLSGCATDMMSSYDKKIQNRNLAQQQVNSVLRSINKLGRSNR